MLILLTVSVYFSYRIYPAIFLTQDLGCSSEKLSLFVNDQLSDKIKCIFTIRNYNVGFWGSRSATWTHVTGDFSTILSYLLDDSSFFLTILCSSDNSVIS